MSKSNEEANKKLWRLIIKWHNAPERDVPRYVDEIDAFLLSDRTAIVEEVREFVANYSVDLCENSQEFKRDLEQHLKTLL